MTSTSGIPGSASSPRLAAAGCAGWPSRWSCVLIAGAVIWVANPFGSTAARLVTAQATTGTVVSSVSLSGAVASSTVEELNFEHLGDGHRRERRPR